ncbi:MAG: GTPase RsgA [Pseudomonadota bacterium]
MTRDYSQVFSTKPATASARPFPLQGLGWQRFFAQQISVEEMAETPPCRVIEVHRNGLHIQGADVHALVPPGPETTVGDWLLWDAARPANSRVLARKSLIARRAPGHDRRRQLIAANLDTAFITSSCNVDFNVARLERYIALALDAGATPVIVLTKADLSEDVGAYLAAASGISDLVDAVALDARGDAPAARLAPWCKPGQKVAFLGLSGVGKSTLTNALVDGGRTFPSFQHPFSISKTFRAAESIYCPESTFITSNEVLAISDRPPSATSRPFTTSKPCAVLKPISPSFPAPVYPPPFQVKC